MSLTAVAALLLLFVSTSVSASSNPRKDPTSFYNMALSATPNEINETTSTECIAAIRAHQGSFATPALNPYLVRIKDIPYQQTADGFFFHYTDHREVADDVRTHHPRELFAFARRAKTADQDLRQDPFLYVAGDDQSSKSYGVIEVRLKINPHAKIFMPMEPAAYEKSLVGKDMKATPGFDPSVIQTVLAGGGENVFSYEAPVQDLLLRDPALKVCESAKIHDERDSLLLMLALEDAHVGVIAYYGSALGWYEILGAWAVDKWEIVK